MHMLGDPRTMQDDPRRHDVVDIVKAFLAERIEGAVAEGVAEERIWVDPDRVYVRRRTQLRADPALGMRAASQSDQRLRQLARFIGKLTGAPA